MKEIVITVVIPNNEDSVESSWTDILQDALYSIGSIISEQDEIEQDTGSSSRYYYEYQVNEIEED
jgi:hypothetical protein